MIVGPAQRPLMQLLGAIGIIAALPSVLIYPFERFIYVDRTRRLPEIELNEGAIELTCWVVALLTLATSIYALVRFRKKER